MRNIRSRNTSFFQDLLGSIAERGRALVDRSATPPEGRRGRRPGIAGEPCRALLSGRGEASGVALARQLLDLYAASPDGGPARVLPPARRRLRPRPRAAIRAAWEAYQQDASPATCRRCWRRSSRRRQELFRRLNLAPGGTAALVRDARGPDQARRQGTGAAQGRRRLRAPVRLLVQSRLSRPAPIDWSTPGRHAGADHPLRGRARDPGLGRSAPPRAAADRRCFGFFHPSLIDEPLIFVEVALTREIPASIQALLAEERAILPAERGDDRRLLLDQQLPAGPARRLVRQLPDQAGGRGAVARAAGAQDLRHPVAGAGLRGLARARVQADPAARRPRRLDLSRCRLLDKPGWHHDAAGRAAASRPAGPAAAYYFLSAKAPAGSRSTRWPASISATAPGSSGSTGWATSRQGPARGARADGQLSLRSALHRGQPRGLRQRGHGRRLGRRPQQLCLLISPPATCPLGGTVA